jgi:hypothetical protein
VINLYLQLDPHSKTQKSCLHLSFACILVVAEGEVRRGLVSGRRV